MDEAIPYIDGSGVLQRFDLCFWLHYYSLAICDTVYSHAGIGRRSVNSLTPKLFTRPLTIPHYYYSITRFNHS